MLFSRRTARSAFSTRVGSPADFDKCSSRLALSENSARRINPIPSSHEQRRALLLESAAPKCSRRLSMQKLWSPCTWYSRYLLVLVSSSARNNKRVHSPLMPDKEAPRQSLGIVFLRPRSVVRDKIMHPAGDYMCIQFCLIANQPRVTLRTHARAPADADNSSK